MSDTRPLPADSTRGWLVCLLIVYLLVGAYYGMTIPPFESPDELHHLGYVVHLVREGRLPIQTPGVDTIYQQEGSQPPLYYVMAAALVRGIDLSDLHEVTVPNPYARIGQPSALENQNLVLHPPQENRWAGSLLALQIARALSLVMGAGTVLCTYALTRRLLPRHPGLALAAAATNAFTPMFLYISASANNDNLITLLCSFTLVALTYMDVQRVTPVRLLAFGGLCGAALLTKLSGIALLALVLLWLLVIAAAQVAGVDTVSTPRALGRLWRRASLGAVLRRWLPWATAVVLPAMAIGGWWYLRNVRLYGELTGIETMLTIFGTRGGGWPTPEELIGELRGFAMSYWGVFGIFNVLMRPPAVYPLLLATALLALLGALVTLGRAWRRQMSLPWMPIGLLIVWIGALLVSLLRWTSMTYASQGRLIFPAISVLSLALVVGVASWPRGRWRWLVTPILPIALLVISVIQPGATIARAYAAPVSLTIDGIPATAPAVRASFGPVELVAYEIDRQTVPPGGRAVLTLYWRARERIQEDLTLYVHVFGRDGAKIAQRDSYHGGGTYPTSYWQPGEVLCDRYAIDIDATAQGPTAAEIVVGLYHRDDMTPIPASDPDGNAVGRLTISRLKVAAETQPTDPQWPTDVTFGDAVRLTGYDLDWSSWNGQSDLPINLHWHVTRPLDRDYTVFLHLVDQEGAMLGQGDAPPCQGDYPTSFWGPGESLLYPHLVRLNGSARPGQQLRILVGLYDPISGERLAATDPSGSPMGDHLVIASPSTAD